MITGTLSQVSSIVGGTLTGADGDFTGVSIDTRTLVANELFVALTGPNFDGHDYVEAAMGAGASGALVQQPVDSDVPQVCVDDSRIAFGALASEWRQRFSIPVIGVTGSNGKTSVKEMLSAILSQRFNVLATRGNLNNDLGVPLTLCRLATRHDVAVIEMGANHVGEIAVLAALARPTVGLVTNAGPAHLEGFGSQDNVALGKGEMFASLGKGATAIVNADDVYAPLWRSRAAPASVVTFGSDGDFSWSDVVEHGTDTAEPNIDFTLHSPTGSVPVHLPLGGVHNVANACAAAAAATAAGVSLDDVAAGLAELRAVPGRLNMRTSAHGVRVIDDSYNANPASLDSAMQFAARADGGAWLVLGDMGELGEDGPELHANVGVRARELGFERVYAVGTLSRAAIDEFGNAGRWFEDADALGRALCSDVTKGVTVLIKGSRSARLERVVDALMARSQADTTNARSGAGEE